MVKPTKIVGVFLLLACTTTTTGFDIQSLIPEMEEVSGSLSQIVASVGSGVGAGEQYRQLAAAEHLLLALRDQIKQGENEDEVSTSQAHSAVAADVAAFRLAVDVQSSELAAQQGVINRLDKRLTAARATIQENKQSIEIKTNKVEETQSQCQAMIDRAAARSTAFTEDLEAVNNILSQVNHVTCEELSLLLQQLSLSTISTTTLGSFLETETTTTKCECAQQPNCDCQRGVASNLNDKEMHLTCTTRKQQARELLDTLKSLLYSASSQDELTHSEGLKGCNGDAENQKEHIKVIQSRLTDLEKEEQEIVEQRKHLESDLHTIETSLKAASTSLESLLAKQDRLSCRFNKRVKSRGRQSDVIESLLSSIGSLSETPYTPVHLDALSQCPPLLACPIQCHCFRSDCICPENVTNHQDCPFPAEAPACSSEKCTNTDLSSPHQNPECAHIVCDYCRLNPTGPGCREPLTALFCAEHDKAMCSGLKCASEESASEMCGARGLVTRPFTGCCFNPLLDCQDKCLVTKCEDQRHECPSGLAVRYPLRGCCFDSSVDCVDQCGETECVADEPVCPAGKKVRRPFGGCCFDSDVDCDDDCVGVVCDNPALPVDVCRSEGKRWGGSTSGCCFNSENDCISGDDNNQHSERVALLALHSSLTPEGWVRSNKWGTDSWICFWDGVECSGSPGRMGVTSLTLPNNNLEGTLAKEMRHLTALRFIDLSNNQITGPLPTEFGLMSNLQVVRVNNNRFTGDIPEQLSALPNLGIVDFSSNFFEGHLPSGISVYSESASVSCRDTCLCEEDCGSPKDRTNLPSFLPDKACPEC